MTIPPPSLTTGESPLHRSLLAEFEAAGETQSTPPSPIQVPNASHSRSVSTVSSMADGPERSGEPNSEPVEEQAEGYVVYLTRGLKCFCEALYTAWHAVIDFLTWALGCFKP